MATYDQLYQSFLNADSVKNGELSLTIANVEPQELGRDGEKTTKLVLYFEEDQRGLPVNKTNYGALNEIFGSNDVDKWIGGKIKVFFDPNVRFAGKRVGGIGVKA